MRILVLTSSYPKYPGDTTAPFIESITRALAARGHELDILLPATPDLLPVAVPGTAFHAYRYAPSSRLALFGYAEGLRADVAVRRLTYLVSPLALVSGAWKAWHLTRSGDYHVIHAHWVVPNGTMALPARWRSGLPLVVSLHGSDVFLSERKRLFRRAAVATFRRASEITACSADLAHRSRALGAPRPAVTIPYGVDTEAFRPCAGDAAQVRSRLGLSPTQPLVLAVGRLVHKKGFEVLIDAIPQMADRNKDLRVAIVGGGDLRQSLEERADRAGVKDRLILAGRVLRDELPAYYAAATVAAVPSIHDDAGNVDGLPNVMLEALASGTPMVASAVAGIPQAVTHGKEALLVPERDPGALARAILKLVDDPAKREALGRRAREKAKSTFDWGRVGEQFEDVFRAVAKTGGTPA